MTTTIEVPIGTSALNITQESDRILFEFVPKFKEGDFVFENGRIMIVKNYFNSYHALIYPKLDMTPVYSGRYAPTMSLSSLSFRYATEDEKQLLIDAMKKDGKRWNAEKLEIEDIPQPKFKKGDILKSTADPNLTVIFDKMTPVGFDSIYNSHLIFNDAWNFKKFRHATKEEKQEFFDELKAKDKRWNAEKLIVEDIPQRKFKPGNKVKLKDGMLDKSDECPYFVSGMHVFIGEVLTVAGYTSNGYILLNEAGGWAFSEDWLELYYDEPIVGELAIFWDCDKKYSKIGIYKGINYGSYLDHSDIRWLKAIKFESREQFLKHIKD